jgi:hypothetical protein
LAKGRSRRASLTEHRSYPHPKATPSAPGWFEIARSHATGPIGRWELVFSNALLSSIVSLDGWFEARTTQLRDDRGWNRAVRVSVRVSGLVAVPVGIGSSRNARSIFREANDRPPPPVLRRPAAKLAAISFAYSFERRWSAGTQERDEWRRRGAQAGIRREQDAFFFTRLAGSRSRLWSAARFPRHGCIVPLPFFGSKVTRSWTRQG